MSLFNSSSPISLLAGVAQTVVVNTEDFTGSINATAWSTPGANDPETAWSQTTGATPSSAAGPNGGANPITRALEASGNGYAYTEATNVNGPWSLESPELDASLGTFSLFFDYFARFGSEGGIADGEFKVQGWNGSAWSDISNSIIGSQQTTANDNWRRSTEYGSYTSAGFSNQDFRFRFLATKGTNEFINNYDFAVDNAIITGPGIAPIIEEPEPASGDRLASILKANRVIFVSPNGNNGNSGLNENLPKRTIQNAISAATPGDAVLIEDGDYYEDLSLSNTGASDAEPIVIAARNPGQVQVLNLIESAYEGTATWTNRGNNVYSLNGHSERAYHGYERDTLLPIPGLRANSDINATSISTDRGTNVQSSSINKPNYGMSFGSGQLRLKLRDGSNPNGQRIALTRDFKGVQFSLNNAPNTIIDGIVFDGAGDSFAINISLNSTRCVVTNCIFRTCQFGIKPGHETLIHNCEYTTTGLNTWRRDLNDVNGGDSSTAIFQWAKNHYVNNLSDLGTNNANDALMEGGLLGGSFNATPADDVECDLCYVHEAFEGFDNGRSRRVKVHHCRGVAIYDDFCECETASSQNITKSGNLQIYENRVTDCTVFVSIQSPCMANDIFVFRNLIEVTDQSLCRMPYPFKTSKTDSVTDIHVYFNTFKHISANNQTVSGFGSHTIFFPFAAGNINGGTSVEHVENNLFIYEDLDQGSNQPANSKIRGNRTANDNLSFWEQNGGGHVGDESTLLMDAQFIPASGSSIEGRAVNLSSGLPDTLSNQDDVGCWPVGTTVDSRGTPVDANWPRPAATNFLDSAPPRWTEPGA